MLEKNRSRGSFWLACATMGLLMFVGSANAAVIVTDTTNTDAIPGLTGFATSGDEMVGMGVTARFDSGFSETLAWAATGVGSGGVTGTGWSVGQSGDTFSVGSWIFDHNRTNELLISLIFNGASGLTVFDRTDGSGFVGQGTAGSASGRDFSTDLNEDNLVVATYSDAVAIGAAAAVEDIWHTLTVDFAGLTGGGVRVGSFDFSQDTDNDSRLIQVPEPASLGLFGLGLIGLGIAVRRRKTR